MCVSCYRCCSDFNLFLERKKNFHLFCLFRSKSLKMICDRLARINGTVFKIYRVTTTTTKPSKENHSKCSIVSSFVCRIIFITFATDVQTHQFYVQLHMLLKIHTNDTAVQQTKNDRREGPNWIQVCLTRIQF